MIYTSRYSNPELRNGYITAVQISTSKPKWNVGYAITHQIADLIPYGIFKNYTGEAFKAKYIERLEKVGVEKIRKQLKKIEKCDTRRNRRRRIEFLAGKNRSCTFYGIYC